jgi:hypothetical protein
MKQILAPPIINQRQVVGLLFMDDLAVGATTRISLQTAINCIKISASSAD